MAAAKASIESVFLREFARSYVSDISFDAEAEAAMVSANIGLADVLYVMKRGRVTSNEKEDAHGAVWVIKGMTCDELGITIVLRVWCDRYCIRVLRVYVEREK